MKLQKGFLLPEPKFDLVDPKPNAIINYSKYGEFQNIGTAKYGYVFKNRKALSEDMVSGVYPHEDGVLQEADYKRMKKQGLLNKGHWDSLKDDNFQRAFYIWAQADEAKGIKTFFTAQILEKAGHILAAIKAYYAVIVHFSDTPGWSRDGTFVWYVGPASLKSIQRLCRDYPQLGLELIGANVRVENGEDIDLTNDVVTVNPGLFISKTLEEKITGLPDLSSFKVIETRGSGKVAVVKYSNGHWQMLVEGKPFLIRGITYGPTEIGLGPHKEELFHDRWMFSDKNKNGRIDAPYDAWVDKNKNGKQDGNEPAVGDFKLMKDIGINAIRFYAPVEGNKYRPDLVNKPLLRDMFKNYGIRVILGDYFGAYTLGSNAIWENGTDYTDPKQRDAMKAVVRAKVMDFKDEPFILMWLLGNENNLPLDFNGLNASRTNAAVYPKVYAEFLNEVAEMIHELDPNHPVAVGNIELGLLEYYNKYASAIDIIGINSYRGKEGFGYLWEEAKNKFDRPILITEYGCDAYFQGRGEDQDGQLEYHRGNLRDIVFHQAGGPSTGNAIGGLIFEYLDEWWKDSWGHPDDIHQNNGQFPFPFPDGQSHEEWLGIVGQGSGKNSPFERRLRKAYYFYKNM